MRPLLIRTLFLYLMAAHILCGCAQKPKNSSAPPPSPAAYYHTDGQSIVNPSGQAILLRIMNSSGLEFGTGTATGGAGCGTYSCYHPHTQTEYDLAKQWGFNAVRLALSWANIEPTAPTTDGSGNLVHTYNEAYLAQVDSAIQMAAADSLPVILSLHHSNWSSAYPQGGGMPGWLIPGQASPLDAELAFLADTQQGPEMYLAIWVMLARRYSTSNNVIGFDIYNEAQRQASASDRAQAVSELLALYGRAETQIHAVDSKLLLVFQDFADIYPELTQFPVTSGGIYSFHSYPPWSGNRLTGINQKLSLAKQWNVPVLAGEVGRDNSTTWQNDLTSYLSSLKNQSVSWGIWAFQFYSYPLYGLLGNGPLDQDQLSAIQAAM